MPISPGDELVGRYAIESLEASDGLTRIQRARDLETGCTVCLEIVLARYAEGDVLSNFEHVLGRLHDTPRPHLIYPERWFHAGPLFVVVWRSESWHTWDRLLRPAAGSEQVSLTRSEAMVLLCSGAAALGELHDLGIVHCDIKPRRLIAGEGGGARISPWLLSRPAGTLVHSVVGTTLYMPPEGFTSKAVLAPTRDVYQLGVVAYELLTGQAPFGHEVITTNVMMRRRRAGERGFDEQADLGALREIIYQATAAEPAERFADGGSLYAAIRAAVAL